MRSSIVKALIVAAASFSATFAANAANADQFRNELSISTGFYFDSKPILLANNNSGADEFDVIGGISKAAGDKVGAYMGKLDSKGNILQSQSLLDGLLIQPAGMAYATNGDLLVAGARIENDAAPNGYVLARFSPDHQLVSAVRLFQNKSLGAPNGVLGTNDGGALVYGKKVVKVDADGTPQWAFKLPYPGEVTRARQTQKGQLLFTGSMRINQENKAFIISMHANAEFRWAKIYDDPNAVESFADIAVRSNGYLVAFGTQHKIGTNEVTCEIVHTDYNGSVVSATRYFLPNGEHFGCTAGLVNDDGTFVAAGYGGAPDALRSAVFSREVDSPGQGVWGQLFNVGAPKEIVRAPNGGYAFAGLSENGIAAVHVDVDGEGACESYYSTNEHESLALELTAFTIGNEAFENEPWPVNILPISVQETSYCQNDQCTADEDGDGYCNELDLCLGYPSPSNGDWDGDGIGDDCDLCPGVASTNIDSDGDGYGDECDNCPSTPNQSQTDLNGDGHGDACVPACIRLVEGDPTCWMTPTGVMEDAEIRSSQPTTLHWGGSLSVGDPSSNGSDQRHTLLRFNTYALPPTAIVQSATLDLHVESTIGDAQVNVLPIGAYWNQYSVTWNNAPATGSPIASYMMSDFDAASRINVPLQGLVQQWVNGSLPNNGVMLQPVSGTSGAMQTYESSEDPLSISYRPALYMCVTIPE